mmetsp:Transcript_8479/g.16644  ORF Transcript_8479/g.16644 Transcript_8479/m.16644 type:complete len:112 (-) Transcript_8479:1044-1379(-)
MHDHHSLTTVEQNKILVSMATGDIISGAHRASAAIAMASHSVATSRWCQCRGEARLQVQAARQCTSIRTCRMGPLAISFQTWNSQPSQSIFKISITVPGFNPALLISVRQV